MDKKLILTNNVNITSPFYCENVIDVFCRMTLFLGATLRETPIMHNGRVVGGRNRIIREKVA